MKFSITTKPYDEVANGLLVLSFTEEGLQAGLSRKTKGPIQQLLTKLHAAKDFTAEKGQSITLYDVENVKAQRIMFFGLGNEKKFDLDTVRKAYAKILGQAKAAKKEHCVVSLPIIKKNLNDEALAGAVIDGMIIGGYSFDRYKSDNGKKGVKEVTIVRPGLKNTRKLSSVIQKHEILCRGTNFTRDLVNENADVVTPQKLASVAQKIAKDYKLKCKVLDEKQLKKLGANLILGVGQGARHPPRLVIVEYNGNKKSKEKIALIGKGITFDSGGLNVKPTYYIETMKQDMGGAAAVLATIKLAAQLKVKKNIIAMVPTAENAVGKGSYKPGDIVKSLSGITVEVGNTDAEGRLVLADGIGYALKYLKPDKIIDIATLTGAVSVAFGGYYAAVVGTDQKTMNALIESGKRTYERVWQLPLCQEMEDLMKSEFADINNIANRRGGYAGVSTGGTFLQKFVNDTPWVHIDIGGTAWADSPWSYYAKGATGFGPRLLVDFLSQ